MQKKLIALAIAGLGLTASAAFAQTNVTIYGIFDATFDSVDATGATAKGATALSSAAGSGANLTGASQQRFSRVQSNSSYIGFKGVEDLGDGLTALFQFETGFNTDSGSYSTTGAAIGRDTYIGLKGGWGTVKLGEFTGPTRAIGVAMDPLPGRAGVGTVDSIIGKAQGGGGSGLFDTRTASTISYITPGLNGFSAVVDYSAGENKTLDTAPAGTQKNAKLWELGVNYNNGPWLGMVAYGKFDAGSDSSTKPSISGAGVVIPGTLLTQKSERVGGGYTFEEGHKINLVWDKQKQEWSNGNDLSRTSWSILGLYKVTPSGSLLASYTKANDASGSYLPAITGPAIGNSASGAKQWTLGYLYALSKRTTLKAVISKISNDTNAAYDFGGSGGGSASTVGGGFGAGADPKAISVGIRHAF